MHRLTKFVLALVLISGPATQGLAKGSLHIERQCSRYGNFCGTETHAPSVIYTKPVASKGKARVLKRAKAPTARYGDTTETEPFIERQCSRYGHFC